MPPDLLAELAQIDGIEAVKQANCDELQPIDGLAVLAGNDDILAAHLDIGGAGGICVASHVVGTEMQRMFDEPDAPGGDRRVAARRLRDAVPAPPARRRTKAALEPARPRRRRPAACRWSTRDERRARAGPRRCSSATGCCSGPPPRERHAARPPARGRRRDRQEHDRRRVRRPDRRRRLRPALPDRRDDGHRPRAARLHVPARARRRRSRRSSITHGHEDHLGALPWVLRELGQRRVPVDLRRPADGRDGALEARRAQAARGRISRCCRSGRRCRPGRSRSSCVHLTHSIPDVGRRRADVRQLGTVLFTGDYKFDQTPVGGAPADVARLAEMGRDGLLLLCGDSTNADRPGISRQRVDRRPEPRARVPPLPGPDRRHLLRVQHPPRAAGRRRRRRATGARSRSSAARCARTSTSAARSGTSTCPRAC